MKIKIKTQGTMAYVDIDDQEIEMIKDHIIEGKGSITIDSVTLNCIVNDDNKTYPSHGLQYPLRDPIVIIKE